MSRKASVFLLLFLLPVSVMATQINGFEVDALQVVRVTERSSGQATLTNIKHITAPGNWRESTYVLGAVVNGQAIAYPLVVLMWHWILNDTVEDQAVVVIFCQLCGSGMLYERSFADRVLTFNASGLLYRYEMLLYDNETKSLWSWGSDSSVAGSLKNTALASIDSKITTLKSWLEQNPGSLIAEAPSKVTGIDYQFTPNDTSALGESVFTGLRITAEQIHPYTPVVGVMTGDQPVAIPASEVLHANGKVTLDLGNETLDVTFDVDRQIFTTSSDVEVTVTDLMTWRKTHPATNIYTYAMGLK